MKHLSMTVLIFAASSVAAEETRQLDSHVHGVSELNIAISGTTIAMELHAPGADIVGFEHAAVSAEDRAAVDQAIASLAKPLELFALPGSAECTRFQVGMNGVSFGLSKKN